MATTTIRVDTDTHAQLLAISEASGASLVDTVRAATRALRRQQFGETVAQELEVLRSNSDSWNAYVAEADAAVSDGIG